MDQNGAIDGCRRQFVAEQPPSWWLILVGVSVWVAFVWLGVLLEGERPNFQETNFQDALGVGSWMLGIGGYAAGR
jgi:hypothetical protein